MQAVLQISELPQGALKAAAEFHNRHLPRVREILQGGAQALAIVLPRAPRSHDGWRRAMAGDLARELAPVRVNLAAGETVAEIGTILAYLGGAPGVTGQYLPTHDQGL